MLDNTAKVGDCVRVVNKRSTNNYMCLGIINYVYGGSRTFGERVFGVIHADGREYVYCSDELEHVALGKEQVNE